VNKLSKMSDDAEKLTIECYHAKSPEPPKEAHQNVVGLLVDPIASMTANIVLEEKEKKRRKLNLIMHNILELLSPT